METRNILILGGVGEARELATRLAAIEGLNVVLSLAGRTASPRLPEASVRVGGFGGAEGLARYLEAERIGLLIDATHPYAARISANAAEAARKTGTPLIVLERAPWEEQPGDEWISARDAEDAARLLGESPKTVFLAIGRQEVAPFARAAQHRYVVRSVEPVEPADLPANAIAILDRGPFDEAAEMRLLEAQAIEVVVSKNSGGSAAYGKIAAARALGLPVVMIARPQAGERDCVFSVEEAVSRVRHLALASEKRGE